MTRPSATWCARSRPYGLLSLGDQLVAYQCHHHSLFLDQTVSDALGGEGWAVRRQAAFEASHALLAVVLRRARRHRSPRSGSSSRASSSRRWATGGCVFEITAEGGTVRGHDLYHGASFRDKYASVVKNRRPVDTFAAGFVSAAASLAFPSDWGTLEAEEIACVARRDDLCVFALTRRPERPRFGAVVTRPLVEQLRPRGVDPVRPRPRRGPRGRRPRAPPARRAPRTRTASLRAFGARLALVPVSYTNQITFDTVHLVEKRSPELFALVATLVREAAQMGAFHLLGGVLASPAWQAEHGPPARELEVRLEQLVGLTRALGWGAFDVEEFVPGRSLVLAQPRDPRERLLRRPPRGHRAEPPLLPAGARARADAARERVDFDVEEPIGRGHLRRALQGRDALRGGGDALPAARRRSLRGGGGGGRRGVGWAEEGRGAMEFSGPGW